MALTSNGNRIGMAAHQQRLDDMRYIAQAQEDEAKVRKAKLEAEQDVVMAELMKLDPNWEAWYDDDNNVPCYGPIAERIEIVRKRIEELKARAELIEMTDASPYFVNGEIYFPTVETDNEILF